MYIILHHIKHKAYTSKASAFHHALNAVGAQYLFGELN